MRSYLSRFRSAPVVTIAMVTYNSARFVREAIASVLAQDFEDFELVVCDDCSTDDTWQLVKGFDDRRIRAVRNETNLGEYRNRNKALELARGRYIIYIDGDDVIYEHGLGLMVRAMERFPGAGFAAALPKSDKFIFPVELSAAQYCRCTYLGPIVLASDFTQLFFRTEALRRAGGFDLRYRTGDLYIQYLLGSLGSVLLISNGLAWWRRRRGQASESLIACGQPIVEMWRYCRQMLDRPHFPLDAREKAVARANLTRMVLRNSLRMFLRGRVANAARMAFTTGIPWHEWRCVLHPYEKAYLGEVTGEQPVHLAIEREAPVAKSPPRRRILPVRVPHPAVVAKRRSMELVTPAE